MNERDMDRRTFVMGSFGLGLAVLGAGVLAGCAAPAEPAAAPEAPEPDTPGAEPEPTPAPASGTSGGRALEATGADLFRIETADAYPDDYDAMIAQVQREQDEGYLPTLVGEAPDWDAYDTVYLGHPIWWGGLPHVMRAFLSQHDLAGKTAAPFSTSSSSGNAAALDALRELCPEADVREALHLTRGSLPGALDEVEPWIEGLVRA